MGSIGIIGAGRLAKTHALSIRLAGEKVGAVYDVVPEAAQALAQETGAECVRSPEEMVERADLEAVVICSPVGFHIEQALMAIEAGKHVMCEKPLAASYAAAREGVERLGSKAERVFMGFNRRFDKGHTALHEGLREGRIGELHQLIITSRDSIPLPIEYLKTSGGLFNDMAIHDFDLARWLLDEEPVSVFSRGSCLLDPRTAEMGDIDTAMVSMETAGGAQIAVFNSRHAAFAYDQRVEAYGKGGMLISDNPRGSGLLSYTADRFGDSQPVPGFFLERYREAYQAEMEVFLRCAREGKPFPCTAVDGMKANYLAEAATASLKSGAPVKVKAEGDVSW